MSEKTYKYKQGDKIYFSLGKDLPSGWGVVEGLMGLLVIVKPDPPIPDYPFTHIYVVDNQISVTMM